MTDAKALSELIAELAQACHPSLMLRLAEMVPDMDDPLVYQEALRLPKDLNPRLLFDRIVKQATNREALALALTAAAQTEQAHRSKQKLELVWTGPRDALRQLRATEDAMVQLIASAQRSLLMVSYTIYNIERLASALEAACLRGVRMTVVSEHTGDQKHWLRTSFGEMSKRFRTSCNFYCWAEDARIPEDGKPEDARYTTMHVKCLVADEHLMLVGSANLTDRAMRRNMELGMRVEGGEEPAYIAGHFNRLIRTKALAPITLE